MSRDMCTGMSRDMCTGMSRDMCTDMSRDMCTDMSRDMCTGVTAHTNADVCTGMYRHVPLYTKRVLTCTQTDIFCFLFVSAETQACICAHVETCVQACLRTYMPDMRMDMSTHMLVPTHEARRKTCV